MATKPQNLVIHGPVVTVNEAVGAGLGVTAEGVWAEASGDVAASGSRQRGDDREAFMTDVREPTGAGPG
jgi:hypothetical protein